MDDKQKAEMIAALIRERQALVVRGLDDRVAQVDVQLRALGHAGAPAATRASRRPASRGRKGEAR